MSATARRNALLLALCALAGAVDAVSYLVLGRVFTANMTGNTVLLGIALATGGMRSAGRNAAAIVGFFAGAVFGCFLVRRRKAAIWPRALTAAVALEALVLAGAALAWPQAPHEDMLPAFVLAVSAVMGLQSAAVQALAVAGISSTYITGTLTLLAREAAGLRDPAPPATPRHLLAAVWAVYIPGAVGGALVALHVPRWALAAPAGVAAAIALLATMAFWRPRS